MKRIIRIGAVVALIASALALSACAKEDKAELKPVVSSKATKEAGVLRVGVDLSTPPFAGKDGKRTAGFDVDVAAALSEKLGLKVKYVDVAPSDVATALASGTADVVLSVPLTEAGRSGITLAGAYADDGPAFFSASSDGSSETINVENLGARKVAVQSRSAAYWTLLSEVDESSLVTFDTLREALAAVSEGTVPVAAGDAFVAAYILRDLSGVTFAGQVGPATPLAVAAAADASELSDAVRKALDELAADGVFDTVRGKWVGDLPALETQREGTESEGDSSATE